MNVTPIDNYILGILAVVFLYIATQKAILPILVERAVSIRDKDLNKNLTLFTFLQLFGTRKECKKQLDYIILIDLMQNEEYNISYYELKYKKDYEDIGYKFPTWKIKLMIIANKKIVYWEHNLELN